MTYATCTEKHIFLPFSYQWVTLTSCHSLHFLKICCIMVICCIIAWCINGTSYSNSFICISFFFYRNTYGISSLVKQILTLEGTSKINDRVFDYSECSQFHCTSQTNFRTLDLICLVKMIELLGICWLNFFPGCDYLAFHSQIIPLYKIQVLLTPNTWF